MPKTVKQPKKKSKKDKGTNEEFFFGEQDSKSLYRERLRKRKEPVEEKEESTQSTEEKDVKKKIQMLEFGQKDNSKWDTLK